MSIKVQTYIDAVNQEQYQVQNFQAQAADFAAQDMAANLKTMFDTFTGQAATGALVHSELLVDSPEPFKVELETCIINLPFANNRPVDNFFDDLNEQVPIVVNLIVESEDLNASSFHIDTLGPIDKADDAMFAEMCAKVSAAWKTCQENVQAKKEQDKQEKAAEKKKK